MRISLLALAIFALPLTPVAADPLRDCDNPNPEVSLKGCASLIKSGRFRGAQLATVHNNLGVAYANGGDREKAITQFSEAIRINPKYALAYQNRARNNAEIGQYDDAIKDAGTVISLNPKPPEVYALRAEIYERSGASETALEDYGEAIKRSSTPVAKYFYARGSILSDLSRHEEALNDLSRAIQLNARNPNYYFARGLSWANAGKCDQAISDYSEALKLSSRYTNAYNNRGVCLSRLGKRDEAIADYEATLRIDPGHEKARKNLESLRARPVAITPLPKVVLPDLPSIKTILDTPEGSSPTAVDLPPVVDLVVEPSTESRKR
jgi:tetratricopeptide (TPR) repeat protein